MRLVCHIAALPEQLPKHLHSVAHGDVFVHHISKEDSKGTEQRKRVCKICVMFLDPVFEHICNPKNGSANGKITDVPQANGSDERFRKLFGKQGLGARGDGDAKPVLQTLQQLLWSAERSVRLRDSLLDVAYRNVVMN